MWSGTDSGDCQIKVHSFPNKLNGRTNSGVYLCLVSILKSVLSEGMTRIADSLSPLAVPCSSSSAQASAYQINVIQYHSGTLVRCSSPLWLRSTSSKIHLRSSRGASISITPQAGIPLGILKTERLIGNSYDLDWL
ncbi:hypothetical protein M378DRAFT_855547 [Amanita muscaria Koide BX008]|uniref:Uncharacterized protein n=1 Tax=Amanita muscaria (strain Koide BX008) TaxID=946122 RepID=A0A0C2T4I8_AMAMK|nr:hypothetical protein M378DRAFT_855547 [Amanita muscaria Koide BX008]